MRAQAFDYIVIGAGSAGCVLANRLSAQRDVSVLVLEAGGSDAHWTIDMPLAFIKAFLNPAFGWGYFSDPEPQLDDRKLWLPRGRLIGGTSTINGMFFMRGHRLDFDGWRDLGCDGWGFADVLPYFKRMETSWRGASPYHGGNGPLHVRAIDTRKLLHEPLMQTAAAAGFATSDDLHAEVQEGFARGEVTITPQGRRASASRAYLEAYIRATGGITQHPVGTCKMGSDALAVVDQQLRVHGIEGLRVADASIMPTITGGNTNAPTIMIGEKASDLILGRLLAPADISNL